MTELPLRGKVVLVTGAGAGMGRAVAVAAASAGARVAAVSLVEGELEDLACEAERDGLDLLTVAADVSDPADTESVRNTVTERLGCVDVLVNNAAIIVVKPLEETSLAEWDRLMAVNVRSLHLYCSAFVPSMKTRTNGCIINVSSLAGIRGRAGETAYTASKFAVEGFSLALGHEVYGYGIRVLTIHPGVLIRTPMSMTTYGEEQQTRWQDPSVIAPAFVHLAARSEMSDSGKRFDAWKLTQSLAGGGPAYIPEVSGAMGDGDL
jgi:NAD(P)-dependent dehydrogenase (short-subunit alcohol dehydrogenase family)